MGKLRFKDWQRKTQVNGCGATNSLVLSDFQLPLEYDEVATIFEKKNLSKNLISPSLSLSPPDHF